jgi:predicted RNA-binding protein with PUA domain
VRVGEDEERAATRRENVDTPPLRGSCRATFGSLLVTTENKAVMGVGELMGSRRALRERSGRKRVDSPRVMR